MMLQTKLPILEYKIMYLYLKQKSEYLFIILSVYGNVLKASSNENKLIWKM